jgi:hypothetical protein
VKQLADKEATKSSIKELISGFKMSENIFGNSQIFAL